MQENRAAHEISSHPSSVQVQFFDARGQPDGAPQLCRNEIGAKENDLVVLRDGCIIAVATSARVLAHEETGRNARRA